MEEFKNANRIKKEEEVASLRDQFERAKTVVLADYKGLTVAEVTGLRNALREQGVEYRVAKNTLIKLATEGMGLENLEPHLNGPTAVAFSYDDLIAPAKVINDFMKKTKKMEFKAGVLEGKYIEAGTVKELADLPSKEVLIAMLLGTLLGPITGMAVVTDAIKKQKEEAEATL